MSRMISTELWFIPKRLLSCCSWRWTKSRFTDGTTSQWIQILPADEYRYYQPMNTDTISQWIHILPANEYIYQPMNADTTSQWILILPAVVLIRPAARDRYWRHYLKRMKRTLLWKIGAAEVVVFSYLVHWFILRNMGSKRLAC